VFSFVFHLFTFWIDCHSIVNIFSARSSRFSGKANGTTCNLAFAVMSEIDFALNFKLKLHACNLFSFRQKAWPMWHVAAAGAASICAPHESLTVRF